MEVMGESRALPEGFIPADLDVMCGWARQNYHHGRFVVVDQCWCAESVECFDKLSHNLSV
jgi:hypothetical protein